MIQIQTYDTLFIMRKLIALIEEADGAGLATGSDAWRQAVLMTARDDEQAIFTVLGPDETNLDRSLFISGQSNYPVFIVNSQVGDHLEPSIGSKVYLLNELTGEKNIDLWLKTNRDVLVSYCNQTLSAVDLDGRLRPIAAQLNEMANYPRGSFGVPLAFFVRPEPRPLVHSARIKVNKNYQARFDPSANFFILLFPPSLAPTHDTGLVSQKDVDGMIKWVAANQSAFWEFINGMITRKGLNEKLAISPYQ